MFGCAANKKKIPEEANRPAAPGICKYYRDITDVMSIIGL